MSSIRVLCIMAAASMLTACGAVRIGPSAQWPWNDDQHIAALCDAAGCTDENALKAYLQASKYCKDIQNYYESDGQVSSATKLSVAAIGTVAGSVIAPVTLGTAAKAWSGVSGAANAMQATFDQTFSTAIISKRQAAVADAADQGSQAFASAGSNPARIVAAVNMARSCSMSPAKADADSFQKLVSGGSSGAAGDSSGSKASTAPVAPVAPVVPAAPHS
jgi:hypothetical protein